MLRQVNITKPFIRLLGSIALLIILSACSTTTNSNKTSVQTQKTSTVNHMTYSYANFAGPSGGTFDSHQNLFSLKTGQEFALSWKPFPVSNTSSESTYFKVTIRVDLIGPFMSVNALHSAVAPDNSTVRGSIMMSTTPIHTDTWTNKTATSVVHLAQNLMPGYYLLVQSVCLNKEGITGGCNLGRNTLQIHS